ncbi:hypothetical protein ABEB36_000347 [Hypothenemus hampei]|uniref:DUF4817 domain-containing protein n=1 Tax=Hypothenemus hampei TaxID=57062 RepID=A0ABD1FDJ8_HYPHA
MVFTMEQKTFMLESYFRNGNKINGVWTYSLQLCMEEFRIEFPNVTLDYTQFRQSLKNIVAVFRETGNMSRKPGSGRPPKRTPEVVEEFRGIVQNN